MFKQQAIRFIAVGLLNTLVGYALYAGFLFLGFDYSISLVGATILGVFFNFRTIGKLVFESNDNSLIYKFFFVYFITFTTNLLLIKLLIRLNLNSYVAGLLVIVPVAAFSFILNKYFVFKR